MADQRPLTRNEVAAIARGAVQEALAEIRREQKDQRRCISDVENVLIAKGDLVKHRPDHG